MYFSDNFKIIGYYEGKGDEKGTVIWEVKCKNRSFRVKPMGSRENRKKLFKNGEKYVGMMLKVYYYEKDEDGCVIRVKSAEEMPH